MQNMNLRMKIHPGEKQNQCFVCGQWFIEKDSLEKHNTLHTVERLYGRGLCGKCSGVSWI